MTSFIPINVAIRKSICSREKMQDYGWYNYFSNGSLFIVCDGHGNSDEVAKFISSSFYSNLEARLYKGMKRSQVRKSIKDTCIDLDENVKTMLKTYMNSGTTFVALFIFEDHIYTINVGDSMLIISKDEKIYFKTNEHTPDDIEERKRIKKYSYIMNGRIKSIINVSRTFGDFDFKKNKDPFLNSIICLPDIHSFNVEEFNRTTKSWALIASDGLTSKFKKEDLNLIINSFLSAGYTIEQIVSIFIKYCEMSKTNDNVYMTLIMFYEPVIDKNITKEFDEFKQKITLFLEKQLIRNKEEAIKTIYQSYDFFIKNSQIDLKYKKTFNVLKYSFIFDDFLVSHSLN